MGYLTKFMRIFWKASKVKFLGGEEAYYLRIEEYWSGLVIN